MKTILRLGLIAAVLHAAAFLVLRTSGADDHAPAIPTFNKEVAPILQKNCMTCHRAGQVAPMSLQNYKEVRPWAKSLREMVAERRMPPWLADPHYGEFANDRRLPQKEVDTIVAWVDGGLKEGNPKDLPANPEF